MDNLVALTARRLADELRAWPDGTRRGRGLPRSRWRSERQADPHSCPRHEDGGPLAARLHRHRSADRRSRQSGQRDGAGRGVAGRARVLRPDHPGQRRAARCRRFRSAGRLADQRAPSGDGEPLFPDGASGLQRRVVRARPAQSGARGGAVRSRLGRRHHRLSQGAERQARRALRTAQHLARRHQPSGWRGRGDGDEPFHARRAGRDIRERVSASGSRVRAHPGFRGGRPLSRRPGLRARVRSVGRQRADGALVQPPVRVAWFARRRQSEAVACDPQSAPRGPAGAERDRDTPAEGRRCDPVRTQRWRGFRPAVRTRP